MNWFISLFCGVRTVESGEWVQGWNSAKMVPAVKKPAFSHVDETTRTEPLTNSFRPHRCRTQSVRLLDEMRLCAQGAIFWENYLAEATRTSNNLNCRAETTCLPACFLLRSCRGN